MADDVEASRYEVSCSMKPFSARLRRMETISAVCNKLDQVMCEFAAARATARYTPWASPELACTPKCAVFTATRAIPIMRAGPKQLRTRSVVRIGLKQM